MLDSTLLARLDRTVEETDFWGVVQVACAGQTVYERARGFAERVHAVPNSPETVFALASGTKSFTALAVMSLAADGVFRLDQPVRGLLGQGHEWLDPLVTVRHLLAHTSGIGDYVDDDAIEDIEDYVLDVPDVPVHCLATPADFVPVLRGAGSTSKFSPGTGFAYCNSGYVILALLIERVTGRSYYDVVEERVFAPAGMRGTAFLRLDQLPAAAAVGYLPGRGWRINHLQLPVRGGGDGGAYAPAGDIARFWSALFAAGIVPAASVREMVRPQSTVVGKSRAYGLGLWLASARAAIHLEGSDAGISFRSAYEPATGLLYTVLSNTTRGAWPVVKQLEAIVADLPREVHPWQA
jgi:CubicO group peptidase (beta-lactamase class C family)